MILTINGQQVALKKDVPHELLMKISGHRTLVAFERYFRIGTEEVANLIREKYSKTK